MSGAAGISAAKNRRSKPIPTQNTIVNCSNVNGSCPTPNNRNQSEIKSLSNMPDDSLVDKNTLKILGPMPANQILKIHEQRLNKMDERINQNCQFNGDCNLQINEQNNNEETYTKIDELETKVKMLEEVIMNLQLTLTNVQSFAMETNLSLTKLQKTTTNNTNQNTTSDITSMLSTSTNSSNDISTNDISTNENNLIPTFSSLSN